MFLKDKSDEPKIGVIKILDGDTKQRGYLKAQNRDKLNFEHDLFLIH